MPNATALLEALRWVSTHQDQWVQTLYGRTITDARRLKTNTPLDPCGTAKCLAGATAELAGWRFVISSSRLYANASLESMLPPESIAAGLTTPKRSADFVASDLLDLDGHEVDALFHGANSMLDLWTYAYIICGLLSVTLEDGTPPLDEDGEPITVDRIVDNARQISIDEGEDDNGYLYCQRELALHFVDKLAAEARV